MLVAVDVAGCAARAPKPEHGWPVGRLADVRRRLTRHAFASPSVAAEAGCRSTPVVTRCRSRGADHEIGVVVVVEVARERAQ